LGPKPAITREQITVLLQAMRQGDQSAASKLIPLVYPDLRRLAARLMREERRGHTLQPTALVHEVYIKLIGAIKLDWQDRAHFFAVAARMMRRILADYGRKRGADKRGGSRRKVDLEGLLLAKEQDLDTILTIDSLLSRMEKIDARLCRVVELRYFGGLSEQETAAALGVAAITVEREWKLAKAWLYGELTRGARREPPIVGEN